MLTNVLQKIGILEKKIHIKIYTVLCSVFIPVLISCKPTFDLWPVC